MRRHREGEQGKNAGGGLQQHREPGAVVAGEHSTKSHEGQGPECTCATRGPRH